MGIGTGKAFGGRMNARRGLSGQRPIGSTGPIWVVTYKRVSNNVVDVLAVLPHGADAVRGPGLRHILVRGIDELDAMRRAVEELDWLKG